MDKIGIFKLLSSAFDFYQKNATKFNKQNEQNNSSFSNGNTQQNSNKEEAPTKNIYAKPLQEGMLSTMRSHNEFKTRVYKNNKQ